jgi:hypothetical protein
MARFAKREIYAQHAALVAFFAEQEAKQDLKTPSSRGTTCNNIGNTPKAINAICPTNQRNSALLRLPAELLINIWKEAFGSFKTMRVHGLVCRDISEDRMLSLAQACSLLHDVLYPIFLSQEVFVVKVSSSHSSVAAPELTHCLDQPPFAFIFNKPIKIHIRLELHAGHLLEAEARKLAAEVQAALPSSTTFQPVVYVEAKAGGGCYCGPGANLQVWHPPAICCYPGTRRPTEQDEVWKGWVVTKRTLNN